jgi:hypothetical protein
MRRAVYTMLQSIGFGMVRIRMMIARMLHTSNGVIHTVSLRQEWHISTTT